MQLLKEALTSRWSYTSTFDSTTLFEWTTLTGAVLPSHAEPPLITNHDSEAVPDQSECSGSFELASPASISAVNGGRGNDYTSILLSHIWNLLVLFPLCSFSRIGV